MQLRPGFRAVRGGGAEPDAAGRLARLKRLVKLNAVEGEDVADTSRNHLGTGFRRGFYVAAVVSVLALLFVKLQGELIRPPTSSPDLKKDYEGVADDYFRMVSKERSRQTAQDEPEKARAKRLKMEREEARQAYEEFTRRRREPGGCDEACEENSLQVQELYDHLTSTVIYDYYKTLDIESGFGVGKADVRRKFEEVKKKVQEGDAEYDHLDLEHVEEAYNVVMNNEARLFYDMFGLRPPSELEAYSGIARHGGPGQEWWTQAALRKKILAWLQYIDNPYLDYSVLALIALLTVLPVMSGFRPLMREMRRSFPELDPETADDHVERMNKLRRQTFQRRGKREPLRVVE